MASPDRVVGARVLWGERIGTMNSKSILVFLGLLVFLAAGVGVFLISAEPDRTPGGTSEPGSGSGSKAAESGEPMPDPFAWADGAGEEAAPGDEGPDLSAAERNIDPSGWVDDDSVEEYRLLLLDRAFETATKMRKDPHIKTRSRYQELAVAEALELGQPSRGFLYTLGIENWRKGLGFARLGLHLAEHSPGVDVEPLLARAELIATEYQADPNFQEWRRDRIRVTAAQAWVLLGDEERVARLSADVEPSEAGKVEQIRGAVPARRRGLETAELRPAEERAGRSHPSVRCAL